MYHVYQNQDAAAYSSLYFFIFLSFQFSTLKFFITLFSGTVRPRILWLMNSVSEVKNTPIVGKDKIGLRLKLIISSVDFQVLTRRKRVASYYKKGR